MKARLFFSVTLLISILVLSLGGSLTAKAQKPEPPEAPKPTPTPPLELKHDLEHRAAPLEPLSAPPNDDFDAALLITALPYQHSIDTRAATVAPDDPDMGCGAGVNSNTVWYRLVPSFYGIIEANTFGSDYDTVLAIFTGVRGSLNRIACNDDASGTLQSQVIFEVEAGQIYYLEVADYGSPGGGQLYFTIQPYPWSILNQYLRTNIASDGRFVIGTTGGDPTAVDDDDKRLLFGYPWDIWSSFATLRVISGGNILDYQLGKDVVPVSGPYSDGITLKTIWEAGGIRVEQRIFFAQNPDSRRLDTTAIEYQLTNISNTQLQAGLRLLLDTMIGDNDGAPLFVPMHGRILQERDFTGWVPDYWIAWESPTFDPNLLKAKGFLRGNNVTTPNRFVVAHWDDDLCPDAGPGLYSSAWDYSINPNVSITCDSAVALYYYPVPLDPGESRTIQTYYGLAGVGESLELAPDVANFVTASRQHIQEVSRAAEDVSIVGDYFLDKLGSDRVQRVVNIVINSVDFLSQGISWARVGRGLNHIATPGYKAALHASWRGWVNDRVAKHWFKPLYDALKNNRRVLFDKLAKAGLSYYAKQAGIEAAKGPIAEWMIRTLVSGSGTPVRDYWGNQASLLGESYDSELRREQDELLARLSLISLTPEQLNAYRADMLARQQANAWIVEQLTGHRDLLWHSYQKALEDEQKWWKFWGPLLVKWGVVGAATLAFDGPGFYVASIGTSAVSTIYDYVNDTRAINHDQKMLDQSLRFLNGRVSMAYIMISQNTVGALNLIRAGDMPEIAGGDVSLQSMKSFGHYRLWPHLWWAEERSQVELSISNTGTFTTTYLTSASYDHSGFWTGTEHLLIEGEAIDLTGGSSGMAVLPLKSKEWGVSPDKGSVMDILVLGATETGIYPVARLQPSWNPTRIEQSTGLHAQAPLGYTLEQAAEAPTLPYPLSSVIAPIPGSSDHELTIAVINPFTISVQAVVTQTLPSEFEILDPGGAQVNDNSLIWSATLEPTSGIEFHSRIRWAAAPGSSISVPEPVLAFQDPNTGSGDTYTAPVEVVSAAWPLASSVDFPLVWQIGESVTVPITLTNISPSIAAQGTFTLTVVDTNGKLLESIARDVNLAAGQTRTLSLPIQVPAHMGYALVAGEVTLGTETRKMFEEVIEIRGYEMYLPLIVRSP